MSTTRSSTMPCNRKRRMTAIVWIAAAVSFSCSFCAITGAFIVKAPLYLHLSTSLVPAKQQLRQQLWGSSSNQNEDDDEEIDDNEQETTLKKRKQKDEREQPTPMQIIDEQRRQIEMLMRIMKTSNHNSAQQQLTNTQQPAVPTLSTPTQQQLVPLKAMMFIDGTWLYYSIHQRQETQCPITKRFGRGWQHYYMVDWAALPRLVCEQIQNSYYADNINYNQNDMALPRPMEISRNSVYTSYSKGTDKNSFRVKMFQQMQQANMDVHIMETLGHQEKCVDIQLAVEMLHYATVPEAYDIAILLSGDKDFVPALVRTRQKGKRVAIVSMRMGCNRALYESPHVKDYNIVWIDDFLDKLIRPICNNYNNNNIPLPAFFENRNNNNNNNKSSNNNNSQAAKPRIVSHITMMKVIYDFIVRSTSEDSTRTTNRVESRQVGRHLKNVEVGDGAGGTTNVLLQLKEIYGGLRLFLVQHPTVFRVFDKVPEELAPNHQQNNPRDKSFWIEAIIKDADDSNNVDEDNKEETIIQHSEFEKNYNDDVTASTTSSTSTSPLTTVIYDDHFVDNNNNNSNNNNADQQHKTLVVRVNYEDTMDYSKLAGTKLKEICREWGLPVSGTKAVLLERIKHDVVRRGAQLASTSASRDPTYQHQNHPNRNSIDLVPLEELSTKFKKSINTMKRSSSSARMNTSSRGSSVRRIQKLETYNAVTSYNTEVVSNEMDSIIVAHLDTLIDEYISARGGGEVGSRDMGRYLAANSSSERHSGNDEVSTALTELKQEFGSLANYLSRRQDKFVRLDRVDEPEIGFFISRVETVK